MLNFFKTKTFKVASLVVALVVAGAMTASAYTFSGPTMKQGSKGGEVAELQTLVGAIADGNFGPATKAKVATWQAAVGGLTVDGVFGPASMAKANGGASMGGSYPAGCTSSTGFSTTTGMSCASSTSYPAGCSSAVGFSPTTGMSCASGTNSGTSGVLTGGAGDINITSTSTDVETEVLEGATDTKVLGFKVEASGSDVAVTNLKVTLKNLNAPTTSYRPTNYATEVAVWMGSTKVGSAMLSDFSKSTYEYSKSISLSNAVVKMGVNSKATFYVTVSAAASIDTTDMATDNWAVLVNNVRFQDGTGVVMTSSDTAGSILTGAFDFNSQALSGDVKVVVSKGTGSPIAQNVTVSTTGSTKDLTMLEFKVKTTGSTASFDTLSITTALTTAGASDTYTTIVGELILKDGAGNTLATLDGSDLDGTETFTLDDTKVVAKDTTETFHVYATILDDSNFTSGAALTVSFASFAPEDSNGDQITDTGSATGAAQTFVYNVPTIALSGTPTLALFAHTDGTTAGLEDSYKATIAFNITAPDNAAVYVPLDSFAYGTNGTAGVLFTKTGGATVTSTAVQYVGTDNLTSITEGSSYRVDAGVTQKFELTVYMTGNDVNGKIAMTGLWYELSNTTPNNSPLVSGLTNLYTPLVYLAK
jgi:hypothetical protein